MTCSSQKLFFICKSYLWQPQVRQAAGGNAVAPQLHMRQHPQARQRRRQQLHRRCAHFVLRQVQPHQRMQASELRRQLLYCPPLQLNVAHLQAREACQC
jgi:hypothetical protein